MPWVGRIGLDPNDAGDRDIAFTATATSRVAINDPVVYRALGLGEIAVWEVIPERNIVLIA
jgi:hypothetical protein